MPAVGQPKTEKTEAAFRPDPAPGADLNGPIAMTDLENRDPDRHYVFVSRNRLALAEYKRMGYRPEVGREGGVHVAGEDAEAGKEIECMDHVLMSVSSERRKSIEEVGAFGNAGQKRVDAIDKILIDKRNVADPFRGAMPKRGGRDYFHLQNETTALEEET